MAFNENIGTATVEIRAAFDQAERDLDRLQKKIDQRKVINLKTGQAEQALDRTREKAERASRSFQNLGKSAQRVSGQLRSFGTRISAAITLPLLGVGVAAVKASTDFETALSRMVGLVGLSKDEVAGFRDEILALGGRTGRAPLELADAMFAVTSAGARGADALSILEKSAMASAAGLGDTRTIALAATAAITAYGKENLDAATAVGVLTATVRAGNLEAASLGPVIGQVIGIAAELGVGFDEVGAAIAAMTRQGLNAAESTTALKSTLNSLIAPTAEAEKTLVALGLPIEKLRQVVAQQGLLPALELLRAAFKGNTIAMSQVFPNVRALTAVLSLLGKNVEDNRKIFEELNAETGQTLVSSFEEAADTTEFKFNAALAELKASAISLGDVLKGPTAAALSAFASVVRDVATAFSELDEGTQKLIVATGLFAAALGPLALALSSLISLAGFTIQGFTAIAGLIGGAGLLTLGVPVLVGVIVALGFAFWDTLDAMSETEAKADETVSTFKDAADASEEWAEALDKTQQSAEGLQQTLDEIQNTDFVPLSTQAQTEVAANNALIAELQNRVGALQFALSDPSATEDFKRNVGQQIAALQEQIAAFQQANALIASTEQMPNVTGKPTAASADKPTTTTTTPRRSGTSEAEKEAKRIERLIERSLQNQIDAERELTLVGAQESTKRVQQLVFEMQDRLKEVKDNAEAREQVEREFAAKFKALEAELTEDFKDEQEKKAEIAQKALERRLEEAKQEIEQFRKAFVTEVAGNITKAFESPREAIEGLLGSVQNFINRLLQARIEQRLNDALGPILDPIIGDVLGLPGGGAQTGGVARPTGGIAGAAATVLGGAPARPGGAVAGGPFGGAGGECCEGLGGIMEAVRANATLIPQGNVTGLGGPLQQISGDILGGFGSNTAAVVTGTAGTTAATAQGAATVSGAVNRGTTAMLILQGKLLNQILAELKKVRVILETAQKDQGGDVASSLAAAFSGGGMASGGPVVSGRTMIVGEDGPELFRARTPGDIVPNDELGSTLGAGRQVVNVNLFGVTDRESFGRRSEDDLREFGRRAGALLRRN